VESQKDQLFLPSHYTQQMIEPRMEPVAINV